MSNSKEKIIVDGFVFENEEEAKQARKEVDKTEGKKAMRQNRFKIV